MIAHKDISDKQLFCLVKNFKITLAGNSKLKIYGRLSCKSGKKMKKENRVFFASELEAKESNFRPCGNCMNYEYKRWKNETV